MKSVFLVLTFTLAGFEEGFAAPGSRSLPKNFIRCKKSDPDLSNCLKNAVVDAFKKMKSNGIPSLGVLPLDPLDVQDMILNSGTPQDPVNLRIDFKNMKVHGVADSTFTDYRIDLENPEIHTIVYSPLVSFVSDYHANGKILILPVTGQGVTNFTMYDLETDGRMTFTPEERNGETYWVLQNFDVKFKPRRMTMYFSGLISQDKTLSDGINNFINENWQVVFEGLRPEFEEAFGAIFKEISNRVFTKVPINKIFLE